MVAEASPGTEVWKLVRSDRREFLKEVRELHGQFDNAENTGDNLGMNHAIVSISSNSW